MSLDYVWKGSLSSQPGIIFPGRSGNLEVSWKTIFISYTFTPTEYDSYPFPAPSIVDIVQQLVDMRWPGECN